MRSDPVQKLTRRPSLNYGVLLADTSKEQIAIHSYYRREKDILVLIDEDGLTKGFVDGIEKTVTGDISTYCVGGDLVLETINDTTFVVNKNTVTAMEELLDDNFTRVSHLNVKSALNYGETLEVTVSGPNIVTFTVSYTIDPATNQAVADEQRKTNTVATEIAQLITDHVDNADVFARVKGSSVGVYTWDPLTFRVDDWTTLEVSAGNGDDDVVAFNEKTESIEGLPLYAITGTRIKVQPDPTSTDGTYYLSAIDITEDDVPFLSDLVEVVWTESRSTTENYRIDSDTMPRVIRYDYLLDQFIIGKPELGWSDRLKGDDESCPRPAFIDRPITALGQFQKRLVLVSDNDVEMTVTDDLFNWWKQTALDLLVSDPISITSNSTGIDLFQYIVEHNRDLLIIASNGQFKIDGTQGITPQTVAMPLTTTQEIQVSVPPVPLGTSVFMPINYGESTGITEYTGTRDQSDIASPVTHHVIGLMSGEAKLLAGSPNLEMLAMTTTGTVSNEVFVYEQFTSGGKNTQQSWSTWKLPLDHEVLHLSFRRDKLQFVIRIGGMVRLQTIDMYSRVAVNTEEVFLDDLWIANIQGDGVTLYLPIDYPETDVKVVGGDDTPYPLFNLPYTRVGRTITLNDKLPNFSRVYVGRTFKSLYEPTRPFREDEQGIAITSDRIRINKYILSVVDTERVTMTTKSKYTTPDDQTKTFRTLNSLENNIGEINLYTGNFQFSYGQNAGHSDVEFWTDGYLGLTISGISWKGQYHKSSGRI